MEWKNKLIYVQVKRAVKGRDLLILVNKTISVLSLYF